jgi:hypothetical protein
MESQLDFQVGDKVRFVQYTSYDGKIKSPSKSKTLTVVEVLDTPIGKAVKAEEPSSINTRNVKSWLLYFTEIRKVRRKNA